MTELSKREQNRLQKAAELAECAHARGDQVIGEYTTAREKVAIRCYKGHLFSIKPSHYKSGQGCAKCAGQCPEQAKADFYKQAEERGDQVVGEYTGTMKKIDMVCSNGHTFFITPNSYKKGHGCAKCSVKCKEKAKEQFLKLAEERGDQVVGEYTIVHKKIDMVCSNGHLFSIKPSTYKIGVGCAKCAGLCPEQAKEQFLKLAEERGDQVVGEYTGTMKKIDMRCKRDHLFSIAPTHYKSGQGCAKCAKHGFQADKQGVLYVVRWDHPRFKSFLKFGITGNLKKRLKDQKRGTEFKPEIITTVKHHNGDHTVELERQIKAIQAKHGGAAITKDDFLNYTETVKDTPEVLGDIQAAIKSFCFGL